ncbi:MAG TPA: DUF6010 family protein [Longimicrobium sp.]|nr:DUF6010 family protein [Longimicrobium sp.]
MPPNPSPSPSPDVTAAESGTSLRAALVGAALAALFAPFMYFFRNETLDLLALLLAACGGLYWGVAATTARGRTVLVEGAAGAAFVAMALLGLWWSSLWVVAGFVLHGVYDFLHHPRGIRSGVQRWYPPFCAAFDWLVAIIILVLR